MLVERRVAEDQAGAAGGGEAVRAKAVHGDPALRRGALDGGLVEVVGQVRDEVQAGGDPRRLELREPLAQRGEDAA